MSVNPLQPSEVEAWFRLMRIRPTPWEVDTLFKMDAAFLDRIRKKKPAGRAKIPASDPAAVRGMMQSLARRKSNGSRAPAPERKADD